MNPDELNYKISIRNVYRSLLKRLDLKGPNFENTPERVANMWYDFMNPEKVSWTTFPTEHKTGMVVVKNHECWSFCPHHLLPVRYMIKIGYLPEGRQVLGLSKLARICDQAMVTMPLQEELGGMIIMPIVEMIKPKGAGAIIQGEHLCMRMRGVESSHAEAVTTFLWGLFLEDVKAREEFISV